MAEGATEVDRFDWRLPLYAASAACIVSVPMTAFADGFVSFLYHFLVAPVICFVLLLIILTRRRLRQRLSTLAMLVAFVAVTGALRLNDGTLRPRLRWLLRSRHYKRELLAAPDPERPEFKHIEWDGWGYAGADTTVYVVFDPTDSLSAPAKAHSPARFRGLPCEVPMVIRLESHWYSVVFYTNADWDNCP